MSGAAGGGAGGAGGGGAASSGGSGASGAGVGPGAAPGAESATKAGPVEVIDSRGNSLGEFGQDGKPLTNAAFTGSKAEQDAQAGRAIERNREAMATAKDKGTLTEGAAKQYAEQDAASLKGIEDKTERRFAAVAVGENALDNQAYREELERRAPELAKEAREAVADNDRRQANKEDRKAADMQAMDAAKIERAQNWTPEQAADQARKDAAYLREQTEKTERYYAAGDMAVSAEHNKAYRETLAKEAPDVAKQVDAQRRKPETTTEAANDPIAPRGQAANEAMPRDTLVIDEATKARLAETRARDTTDAASQLGLNGIEPVVERKEAARLDAEEEARRSAWLRKADQDAQQATQAASAPKSQAGNNVASDEVFEASDTTRPVVPQQVEDKYLRVGNKFYHPKNTDVVAFEDKGNKLETKSDSEQIAETMVTIARARGWDEIKVSGSETFRKEVWLEAAAHGMHVKGYTPSEQDKAELAKRSRETESNRVEQGAAPFRGRENGPASQQDQSTQTDPSAKQPAATTQRTATANAAADVAGIETGVIAGTLMAHGSAPYQNNKENSGSYYATVRDGKGNESTTWGIDLQRAIAESKAQVGDQVTLRNEGRKEVVVEVPIKDARGKVVAVEEKPTHRNAWNVELAKTFANETPSDAVKKHPELAGTYAAAASIDKKAEADGLSPEQRAVVMQRVRQNIVNSIERGEIPAAQIKESQEVKLERKDERELSR